MTENKSEVVRILSNALGEISSYGLEYLPGDVVRLVDYNSNSFEVEKFSIGGDSNLAIFVDVANAIRRHF